MGFLLAGLISIRLVWGFVGGPYARFSQFVCSPRNVLIYLLALSKGNEARHIGHNPAGGAMILVLLGLLTATVTFGWMMTTDSYYGIEWVEATHSVFAYLTLAMVALHVTGVALASYRHRENLVRAMISGNKRWPGKTDVA